jgi:hypothetical protein
MIDSACAQIFPTRKVQHRIFLLEKHCAFFDDDEGMMFGMSINWDFLGILENGHETVGLISSICFNENRSEKTSIFHLYSSICQHENSMKNQHIDSSTFMLHSEKLKHFAGKHD